MTVTINITVLWAATTYGLAELTDVSVEPAASIFRVDKKAQHE
jgi:hypothetical protein